VVQSVALEGCADFVDIQEALQEMIDGFVSERPMHRSALRRSPWHRVYRSAFAPGVPRPGGFEGFEPSTAIYAARGVREGALSEGDAAALRALAPFGEAPFDCHHSHVACAPEGGSGAGPLRVVALRLQADAGVSWLEPLARLSALRGLTLSLGPAEDVPLAQGQLEGLRWPELRALELILRGPMDAARQHLVSSVIGRQMTLQSLYVLPQKYEEFGFDLSALCGLVDLRTLLLPDMNIREVPECFQRLRELRYVYLACNYLTSAPRALRGLPELRAFVAFRQGEYTPCHLTSGGRRRPTPQNLKDRKALKRTFGDCKYIWETKVGIDVPRPGSPWGGGDNPRVVCPWVALRGSLRDWLELEWPKLEKLWLDGNFISGPIPEELPEAWPRLRSLDLYSNNLSGPIPSSLAEVPWVKLQLQDNQLSGSVPGSLFRTGCCEFNIALNPGLAGCLPPGAVEHERIGRRGFFGTGVRQCQAGDPHSDRKEL